MRRISNLLHVLVIFSVMNPIFSAVHFNTRPREGRKLEYGLSKIFSTYRGVMLTLSVSEKDELCQEAFSVQLYAALELKEKNFAMKSLINDGTYTAGDPQYPLIVRTLDRTVHGIPYPPGIYDIYFRCVGRSFVEREPYPEVTDYYFSYGFRSGWFYANALDIDKKDGKTYMEQINLFMKSPRYIELDPDKLEDQYASIRQIMRTLEQESPKYVEMIEKRSNLLPLSKFKRDLLCASVLSSPIYRRPNERLEFSLDKYGADMATTDYEKKKLKFVKRVHDQENFEAYCILCHAYVDQDDKGKNPKNVFITPSYDDKHSLYVLKEESKGIFLSKYFTHFPLLMNAQVATPDGFIYKNYNAHDKLKKKGR